MVDFTDVLGAVEREVIQSDDRVTVRLRRRYPTSVEDLWEAITDTERLGRWFAPVSGDLREGGKFDVSGNASGEILRCEPPRYFKVTWGGDTSLVEVRLEAAGPEAALTLEHSVPLELAQSAAGALFSGPGWDEAFLALGLYLDGEEVGDPASWESSLDVQRYAAKVIDAWAEIALRTASPEAVEGAKQAAHAQFTPDL